MAEFTGISWADSTKNLWFGCHKIGLECQHCYADRQVGVGGFYHHVLGEPVWGKDTPRVLPKTDPYIDLANWNKAAAREGRRRRIFINTWSDVFEDRRDLDEHRARFFEQVRDFTNLDFMLLTKRHDRIMALAPWRAGEWPSNIWLGVTAGNQEMYDLRVASLVQVPAAVRFVSIEPMLGPVQLGELGKHLDWVIVGGESGLKRENPRRVDADWVRAIRDECVSRGIAFYFKQWGGLGKAAKTNELEGRTWTEVPNGQRR